MKEKASVKLFRFDPSKDKEPRYEDYEVPFENWHGVNCDGQTYQSYGIDTGYCSLGCVAEAKVEEGKEEGEADIKQ